MGQFGCGMSQFIYRLFQPDVDEPLQSTADYHLFVSGQRIIFDYADDRVHVYWCGFMVSQCLCWCRFWLYFGISNWIGPYPVFYWIRIVWNCIATSGHGHWIIGIVGMQFLYWNVIFGVAGKIGIVRFCTVCLGLFWYGRIVVSIFARDTRTATVRSGSISCAWLSIEKTIID